MKKAEYDPTLVSQKTGWDDKFLQGRKQLSTTSGKITPDAIRQIADE